MGNRTFQELLIWNKIPIVSDHKALATVLKGNKIKKTYSSRLTRWVDRLLPFDFEIFHAPGVAIGIADYLSRHLSQIEGESVKAKDLCDNWFTVNHVSDVNSILAEEFNRPIRGRQWLKLRRDDKCSKSKQTHKTHENRQRTRLTKMGQNNSSNALADNDNNFELEMSDFLHHQDSEIVVRERARGSKLEDTYKPMKGRVINETQHTLTKKPGNQHEAKVRQ